MHELASLLRHMYIVRPVLVFVRAIPIHLLQNRVLRAFTLETAKLLSWTAREHYIVNSVISAATWVLTVTLVPSGRGWSFSL